MLFFFRSEASSREVVDLKAQLLQQVKKSKELRFDCGQYAAQVAGLQADLERAEGALQSARQQSAVHVAEVETRLQRHVDRLQQQLDAAQGQGQAQDQELFNAEAQIRTLVRDRQEALSPPGATMAKAGQQPRDEPVHQHSSSANREPKRKLKRSKSLSEDSLGSPGAALDTSISLPRKKKLKAKGAMEAQGSGTQA